MWKHVSQEVAGEMLLVVVVRRGRAEGWSRVETPVEHLRAVR